MVYNEPTLEIVRWKKAVKQRFLALILVFGLITIFLRLKFALHCKSPIFEFVCRFKKPDLWCREPKKGVSKYKTYQPLLRYLKTLVPINDIVVGFLKQKSGQSVACTLIVLWICPYLFQSSLLDTPLLTTFTSPFSFIRSFFFCITTPPGSLPPLTRIP